LTRQRARSFVTAQNLQITPIDGKTGSERMLLTSNVELRRSRLAPSSVGTTIPQAMMVDANCTTVQTMVGL